MAISIAFSYFFDENRIIASTTVLHFNWHNGIWGIIPIWTIFGYDTWLEIRKHYCIPATSILYCLLSPKGFSLRLSTAQLVSTTFLTLDYCMTKRLGAFWRLGAFCCFACQKFTKNDLVFVGRVNFNFNLTSTTSIQLINQTTKQPNYSSWKLQNYKTTNLQIYKSTKLSKASCFL